MFFFFRALDSLLWCTKTLHPLTCLHILHLLSLFPEMQWNFTPCQLQLHPISTDLGRGAQAGKEGEWWCSGTQCPLQWRSLSDLALRAARQNKLSKWFNQWERHDKQNILDASCMCKNTAPQELPTEVFSPSSVHSNETFLYKDWSALAFSLCHIIFSNWNIFSQHQIIPK